MDDLQAIFFDVGNTLLFPSRELTLAPLHQRGIFPSPDHLRRRECDTKRRFDGFKAGGRADFSFWQMFYSTLLHELQLHDHVLLNQLVRAIRLSANWCEIRPGTRDALLRLKGRYRLGVISNADGRIDQVLARCRIADCFETITDSGVIGSEKPQPAIFAAALRSLDIPAAASLYVGDVYSVDYAGATAAGMRAMLFDACGAYRDATWPRVESLEDLERSLAK